MTSSDVHKKAPLTFRSCFLRRFYCLYIVFCRLIEIDRWRSYKIFPEGGGADPPPQTFNFDNWNTVDFSRFAKEFCAPPPSLTPMKLTSNEVIGSSRINEEKTQVVTINIFSTNLTNCIRSTRDRPSLFLR